MARLKSRLPKSQLEHVSQKALVQRMQALYGEASLPVLVERAWNAQEKLSNWIVEIDTLIRVINIPAETWTVDHLYARLKEQKLLRRDLENNLQRFIEKLGNGEADAADALNKVPEGLERARYLRDAGILSTSRKNTPEYKEYLEDSKVFRSTTDSYIKKLRQYGNALAQQIALHEEQMSEAGESANLFGLYGRSPNGFSERGLQLEKLPMLSHALDAYIHDVESYRNGEMQVPRLAFNRKEFPALRDYNGEMLSFPHHVMEGGAYQKQKGERLTHWELKQAAWKEYQLVPNVPLDPRTMKRGNDGEILPQTTTLITTGQKTPESAERSFQKRKLLSGKDELSPYVVTDLARVIIIVDRPENIQHVKELLGEKLQGLTAYNNLQQKRAAIMPFHYKEDFKEGGMANFAAKLPLNGVIVEVKMMERGQFEAYMITHKIYEIQRRMEADGTMLYKQTAPNDPHLLTKARAELGERELDYILGRNGVLTDPIRQTLAQEVNDRYAADRQLMQAEYQHVLYEIETYHKAAQAVLRTQAEFRHFEWLGKDGYGKSESFDKEQYEKRYRELKAIHQAIHVSYMLSPGQLHTIFGKGAMLRQTESGQSPVHEARVEWRMDYAEKILRLNEKAEQQHLKMTVKSDYKPVFPKTYIDLILSPQEREVLHTAQAQNRGEIHSEPSLQHPQENAA